MRIAVRDVGDSSSKSLVGASRGRRGFPLRRSYDVGDSAYYFTGGLTSNQQVYQALAPLRRLCRAQYQRNDYAKAAVRTVKQAVVGGGVKLRLEGLEQSVEEAVLRAWKRFTAAENLTALGDVDLDQVAEVAVASLMYDGEFLATIGGDYPAEAVGGDAP